MIEWMKSCTRTLTWWSYGAYVFMCVSVYIMDIHVCVWGIYVLMCAQCVYLCVEVGGQYQMPSSIALHLVFGDRVSHWTWGLWLARLASQGAPGILLSPPLHHWDYRCIPLHLFFYFVLFCFLLFYESTWDPPTYRVSVSLAKLSPKSLDTDSCQGGFA